MLAAVIAAPGKIELRELPDPQPGPYQCFCEMLAVASCSGTDSRLSADPGHVGLVLGHESIGRVVSVGDQVRYLKPGDQVLRCSGVYPGEKLGGYGSAYGGFATRGLVTDLRAATEDGADLPGGVRGMSRFQQVVPAEVNPCDATMLITLKETLSWLQCFSVTAGASLLIYGDGAVGQAFVRMAKIVGATPVISVGHHETRLAACARMGADLTVNLKQVELRAAIEAAYGARPIQFVIDAVGRHELIDQSLPLMAEHSAYSIYGIADDNRVAFDKRLGPTHWQLRSFYMDEAAVHAQALDQVRLGMLNLRDYYDAVVPFGEIDGSFNRLRRREIIKFVVDMSL
jgi:threonine dehydrogenase-like Zn-dependent dehydrogenase